MQNPFNAIPMPPVPNTAEHHLMRPINQRLPNTSNVNNSNSASLPSQAGVSGLNEASFRPASVINLSHSNDVVIGPMTQYQGAVTIYQYMDATVEATVGRVPGSNGLGELRFLCYKNEKVDSLVIVNGLLNFVFIVTV